MDTLIGGGALLVGQQLQSNNGRYVLPMQNDGNLVLYAGPTAVWATNTWSLPVSLRPNHAIMQNDGNFVLYSPANNPAWASGTDGHPGSRIVLQDDRNLVIYDLNSQPLPVGVQYLDPHAVTCCADNGVQKRTGRMG
jgi:hypothetical protein